MVVGSGVATRAVGRRWKVQRDPFLEHSVLRHLTARPRIWVCTGDDGWSDGPRDPMASPPSSPMYVSAGIGGDVSAYVGALSFSPSFSLFAIFSSEGGLFFPL